MQNSHCFLSVVNCFKAVYLNLIPCVGLSAECCFASLLVCAPQAFLTTWVIAGFTSIILELLLPNKYQEVNIISTRRRIVARSTFHPEGPLVTAKLEEGPPGEK